MSTTAFAHRSPSSKKGLIRQPRRHALLLRFTGRRAPDDEVRNSCPRLAPAEQKANGRERMVLALLPLVKRTAQQMRDHLPPHVEVGDLVGAGVLGLIDAIGKFDASKHVRIESYARHRIRGAILDGLRSLDHASRDLRKKNRRVERVYYSLEAQLCRKVSDSEMAQALGVSLNEWYRTMRELQALGVSWWQPMGSVGIKDPGQSTPIAGPQDDPFYLCYRRQQKDILNRAMACLTPRERLIVWHYYDRGLTMKQIGAKLGIDESRVSQLHSATLRRLRARVTAILRAPQHRLPFFSAAPGVEEPRGERRSPCQHSLGRSSQAPPLPTD